MSSTPHMRPAMGRYDVAVVGGGPVGCVAALAHARRGARVLVLEANPKASRRLAGEWLHPPAVDVLRRMGVSLPYADAPYPTGQGFVLHPDDGGAPFVLPYAHGGLGFAVEHDDLVAAIRETATAHPNVVFVPWARVSRIEGQRVVYERRGRPGEVVVHAGLIVGADGRSSIVRETLGLPVDHTTCSRMAGVLLRGAELTHEGFGHVFLGGPGPVLAYRIGPDLIRLCIDVPRDQARTRDKLAWLHDAFTPVLPEPLRPAFRQALLDKQVLWAANQVRPRLYRGRPGMVLVGDACGHYHPLTAAGMTLGFGDAETLAEARSFRTWSLQRRRDTRAPEMLAVALYEVFADQADEAVAIRRAVYRMWREMPAERRRTMDYLACQDRRLRAFGGSFTKAVRYAVDELGRHALSGGDWGHALQVTRDLLGRMGWLTAGILHLRPPTATANLRAMAEDGAFERALHASRPSAEVVELSRDRLPSVAESSPPDALARGVESLLEHQRDDGSWEGEVVWCPMLPAQYVLACHAMGRAIPAERRRRLLLQFERTRLEDGAWGLHAHSDAYLFTTTLVYAAARLLGVAADDPLVARARDFIEREGGAVGVPSWGKLWLALVGLYEWEGVNAVLPEVWRLPESLPLHPGNYYCHTRLIYLAMATVYASRHRAPLTPTTLALRHELFPQGWDRVDWAAAKNTVRPEELHTPHSAALKLMYRASAVAEKLHDPEARADLLADLRERIRWELRTTDHTSISPVSGLLNLVALWLHDPTDLDLQRGLQRFEGWIREDDEDGTRIAGARSASWDTAFAVQTLTAAAPHVDVSDGLRRGTGFLRSQQIRRTFEGYAEHHRVDPKGGWCFAGDWHGWPVSDCTAEALEALLSVEHLDTDDPEVAAQVDDAARFILRTQNAEGGFGSYEARKTAMTLEWMNPAEMFGDSMTEHSYVECTASCIAALAAFRQHRTGALSDAAGAAVASAAAWLRRAQRPDGSWPGVWGVSFVYGTLFGIRGLRAAGAPVTDPALRKACAWLLERQRPDGGWGEHHSTCLRGEYVEHEESQVIQTAWALSALLAAHEPDWSALDRGARWLAAMQGDDGEWPRQDMAGVFFHTALLEYEHYRRYFPVWALALFETRRRVRLDGSQQDRRPVAGRRRTS
ncbi:MAG: FAD-dependent oxidoreductase [Myxococcota bacterium]